MTSLKQWRKARNLTQERAADLLCISPRHLQKLEAGHRNLTPAMAKLMELIK